MEFWRWFAWSNQVLAAISLWVATGYLTMTSKNKFLSLFTAIPATFMTSVVVIYILAEPQLALGSVIPYWLSLIIGFTITLLIFGFYMFRLLKRGKCHGEK